MQGTNECSCLVDNTAHTILMLEEDSQGRCLHQKQAKIGPNPNSHKKEFYCSSSSFFFNFSNLTYKHNNTYLTEFGRK